MKTKKFNKKLLIKKTTIATLNNLEKKGVMAGYKGCTELSGCDTSFTCVSNVSECEC